MVKTQTFKEKYMKYKLKYENVKVQNNETNMVNMTGGNNLDIYDNMVKMTGGNNLLPLK